MAKALAGKTRVTAICGREADQAELPRDEQRIIWPATGPTRADWNADLRNYSLLGLMVSSPREKMNRA
jgi:hypothetical protein